MPGLRLFLALAIGGVLPTTSVVAQPKTSPAPSAPTHFTLLALGEGAYAAIAKPQDRASVGNAGFVIGPDAVLVVDAFATSEAAEELSAAIRRNTPATARCVAHTHHHP